MKRLDEKEEGEEEEFLLCPWQLKIRLYTYI
jgi:hypothetical protein